MFWFFDVRAQITDPALLRVINSFFSMLVLTTSPCRALFWTGRGLYVLSLGSDAAPTFAIPLYEFDDVFKLGMSWERVSEMLHPMKLFSEFQKPVDKSKGLYIQAINKVRALKTTVSTEVQIRALDRYLQMFVAKMSAEIKSVVPKETADLMKKFGPVVTAEDFTSISIALAKESKHPAVWVDWFFDDPMPDEVTLACYDTPPTVIKKDPFVHVTKRAHIVQVWVREWICRLCGSVNDEVGPVKYWAKHPGKLSDTMIGWWVASWPDEMFKTLDPETETVARRSAYDWSEFDLKTKSEEDIAKALWFKEHSLQRFVTHQKGPFTWTKVSKNPELVKSWTEKYDAWLKIRHSGDVAKMIREWKEEMFKTYVPSGGPEDLVKHLKPRFDVPTVPVFVSSVAVS